MARGYAYAKIEYVIYSVFTYVYFEQVYDTFRTLDLDQSET